MTEGAPPDDDDDTRRPGEHPRTRAPGELLRLWALEPGVDFRSFLRSVHVVESSAARSGLSLARFAERLGLGASLLKMVLEGSRNLTVQNVHRVARGLRLTHEEHELFEALVLRDQAHDESERAFYTRRLAKLGQARALVKRRTPENAFLEKWYFPALVVYLLDIARVREQGLSRETADAAAAALGIAPAEVREVFARSLEAGLFRSDDEEGKLHFVFERVSNSFSKKRFLKDVLAESARRLETEFDNPRAFFTSDTFSLPAREMGAFIDAYKALIERFLSAEANEKKTDLEIVQVCFQMFPFLSRGRREASVGGPRRLREGRAQEGSRTGSALER